MTEKLNHFIETESHSDIQETLQFLLHECTLDEAPSIAEVTHWQHLLLMRGNKFLTLAALCQDYINEQQQ